MAKNLLSSLLGDISGWADKNAEHYLYVTIPHARTDADYDDAALKPYRSYFRLWLSEMFLTKNRLWFKQWCPAVHASVSLNYGGQPAVSFDRVASLPVDLQAKGVVLNYKLSELMPYNGGTVEITAGLLAMPMQESDFLATAVKVFGDFASLVAPPLGAALAVSQKVATGFAELMSATGGKVHMSLHQNLTGEGGGGSHDLRPGYLAVIMATTDQINQSELFVSGDRLHYRADGKGQPKPLLGYDYMLFRVEGREQRDDWRLKNIQEPTDNAVQALLKGNQEEANAYTVMALAAAYQSPDLAIHDRRRVVQAIKEELAQVLEAGKGIQGTEDTDLNHIMDRRAIGVRQALHLPAISFTEALKGAFKFPADDPS